jgi:hypothetical protein
LKLSPQVALIIINPILDEELQVFFLEAPLSMVLSLIPNVTDDIGDIRFAHCERARIRLAIRSASEQEILRGFTSKPHL